VAFRITIIGLGLVGSSIGLALKKAGADLEIVGHDKDHGAAKSAYKNKSVDRTEWNLISACDGADLIVICTPLAGIKSTLTAIAAELKEGCVVTDTASLKVPVLNWARESLPATVHFVGGHPIIGKRGVAMADPAGAVETGGEPRADLFAGAVYCLTPASDTPPVALQRVSDLAEAIGAKPYYMEATEHDGLIAVAEQVPLLMALALQDLVSSSPAHREIARLSGADFQHVTQPLAGDAQALSEVCDLNAANIARWLDSFLGRLSSLRESVAHSLPGGPGRVEKDGQERQGGESLQEALARALEAHAGWARQEMEGKDTDYSNFSATRMMLGDTFRSRRKDGEMQ